MGRKFALAPRTRVVGRYIYSISQILSCDYVGIFTAVNRSVLKIYVKLRRFIRSLVLKSSLLERLLSRYLVTVESLLPLHWFVRFAPNPLIYDGQIIFHRPEDQGVTLPILFYGEYEPETTQLLKQVLLPGMNVVDLGAHIGYYTLLAARLVEPGGKVYAFEPVPETFELLVKNVKVNGYDDLVVTIPKAISSGSSRIRIFSDSKSSVSAKCFPSHNGQAFFEVDAISLDEFFREKGWPSVHLVKMDIEGAERAALEGMKELSFRNPAMKLIIEVNFQNLVHTGTSFEQFFEALQACGFSRFRVLWRREGYLEIPKDIPRLAALAQHVNVNLLCDKTI